MADDYDIHPGMKSVHVDVSENDYNVENVGGRPHRSGRRGRNAYGGYGYAPDPLLYTIVQNDDGSYSKVADDDTDDDKGSNVAGAQPAATDLKPGWFITTGQSVYSPNRRAMLTVQTDGNVVMYDMSSAKKPPDFGASIWSSNTNGKGVVKFIYQPDGNLVAYDKSGKAQYATNTQGKTGATLNLQDDGNLVIYQGSNAVWNSDSYGFTRHKHSSGGILSSIGKVATTIGGDVVHAANAASKVVGKLPVVGSIANDVMKLNPATALGGLAVNIAKGKNVGKSLIAAGIENLSATKDLAPYINMIVPGVGTTIASAAGAALDLAHGRTVTDDLVKTASQATGNSPLFAQAYSLASSNAVSNAAALTKLLASNPAAQKAITTATALGAAKSIQSVVAQAVAHPDNAASLAATGAKAVQVAPMMARAAPPANRAVAAPVKMGAPPAKVASIPVKSVPGVTAFAASPSQSPELYGYQVGVGLLSHSGVTPYAIVSARQGLTPAQQVGFDHAIKTLANQANPSWPSLVSGGIVLRGNWKAVRAGTPNAVKGRVVQNGKVTSGYYSRA